MQFFKLLAVAATLAVANAVQFTNVAADFVGVSAGKPFTITWTGASGAVTINLKTGLSTAQTFVSTIASAQTGTSFVWTPPSTLPVGTYNLEITDSTAVPNYSVQFPITGGTGTSTPGSTAASTSASAASSATAASSAASSSITTVVSSSVTSSAGSSSSTGSHSSSSSRTSAASTAASGTTSAASVPTSNSAVQNGSPFALVILGALALAGMN